MIASSRTSLLVGAAMATLVGVGCSRAQSAPQPVASSGATGSASPHEGRSAGNEPGATASGERLDSTGLPLPRGSTLVSSGTVNDFQAFPANQEVGPHTRIVAGGIGVGAVDRVYETSLSYPDAVAFYDRVLKLENQSPYSLDGGAAQRTVQGNSTEWSFAGDHGDPERVVVSGGRTTRISIAHETAAAAVETERTGRANAQPGSTLEGSKPGRSNTGRAGARDGGRSIPPSSGPNGE